MPNVITASMREQARLQAAEALASGADPITAALDAVDVALTQVPDIGQLTDETLQSIWNGMSVHSTQRTQKKALRAGIELYLTLPHQLPPMPTAPLIDAVAQELIDEGFTDLHGRELSWERHGDSLRTVAERLLRRIYIATGP